MTANEIKNLSRRLRIAKLILKGESERDIGRQVHASFATIVKVHTWLNQGGQGLKNVLSKLPAKYSLPKNLPVVPLEFQLPRVLFTLGQSLVAKDQNKMLNGLTTKIREKSQSDKSLQKVFDQYFIEKSYSKLKREK